MNETDGNRLERLLGDRNRAAFAREHKIRGGGSMMSQQISGQRPISFESAVAYAQALGVALEAISPAYARAAREASALLHTAVPTPPAALTLAQALEVLGMALAPRTGAAGSGIAKK